MHRSRKFCQRGSNSFFFFFLVDEGREDKPAIIGPTAKGHLNGVSLADRCGPTLNTGLVALRFFRGSGPVLLRNPIFFEIFQGGGDPLDWRM